MGQTSAIRWVQGFEQIGDSTGFFFDAEVYGKAAPQQVVVTGSFRNWSQEMDDAAWQLRKITPSRWKLMVHNPTFEQIPPRAEFKFRINEGEWLAPPGSATNTIGSNLIAFPNMTPPLLAAEIHNSRSIWIRTDGYPRPLSPDAYRLTDAAGTVIPLADFLPNTEQEGMLIPGEDLDIGRIYYVEIPQQRLKSWCSFDGWFRKLYSDKELGANISKDGSQTTFRIFSPRAKQIKLYLYREATIQEAFETIEMVRDEQGVWEWTGEGDLKGVYYDFTVHGPDEPGNHFFETEPTHISDPYARVNMDAWGRSRVWSNTTPASPLADGIPALEDVIAYEVHVQDFTDLLPIEQEAQGTLVGMSRTGLKNKAGKSIGLDYLSDLGVNVVHLQPVQEFMHYPDEVWKASFAADPFMQEMGIAEENYQWGYRTSHCFAIESKFRGKGDEPGEERDQFRDFVQACHDRNMAVIIDIVPNHTAENMDDEPHFFHFNVLDKLYYYRTRELDHIGEYGNEVKVTMPESSQIAQRFGL
ncbi:MAG: alpha-amylase family glycosyl hydrolase [Bacteroidota bacterium]